MVGDSCIGQHSGYAYPCTNGKGLFITDADKCLSPSLPFPFSHLYPNSDSSPPKHTHTEQPQVTIINNNKDYSKRCSSISIIQRTVYTYAKRALPRRWQITPPTILTGAVRRQEDLHAKGVRVIGWLAKPRLQGGPSGTIFPAQDVRPTSCASHPLWPR